MKKIYSIFTLTVILAIFLCFPASAAQINGVIYDETDSLGSPTLTMQGEETLPQLSDTLGTELRVDVLTRINPESMPVDNGWCIYANLNNDKDSSEKLAEAIDGL